MCKKGQARARQSGVWVLPAASADPGQGETGACSSVPLAAGTVEHFQADGYTFPPLGLPQEGRGCGG